MIEVTGTKSGSEKVSDFRKKGFSSVLKERGICLVPKLKGVALRQRHNLWMGDFKEICITAL